VSTCQVGSVGDWAVWLYLEEEVVVVEKGEGDHRWCVEKELHLDGQAGPAGSPCIQ
jgi:hypothetical protein